jgi:hypothetical protein
MILTDQIKHPFTSTINKENNMIMNNHSNIRFLSVTALCGMLTGCVGYVDGPPYAGSYSQPRTGYYGGGAYMQDDYVYYPSQQVYYSSNRRQYTYQDGSSWVTRSSPPRVYASALHTSPSVKLDFHDSPQSHHANVVRQYPQQWTPSGSNSKNKQKNHGNSAAIKH